MKEDSGLRSERKCILFKIQLRFHSGIYDKNIGNQYSDGSYLVYCFLSAALCTQPTAADLWLSLIAVNSGHTDKAVFQAPHFHSLPRAQGVWENGRWKEEKV